MIYPKTVIRGVTCECVPLSEMDRLRAELAEYREFVREVRIAATSDETGTPDDAESVWAWLRCLLEALAAKGE